MDISNTQTSIHFVLKIIKANDLMIGDVLSKSSDPYCVFGINYNLRRNEVYGTTKIIKHCLNPEWNEQFHVSYDVLCERPFVIEVYDYDIIGKDDFLGCVAVDLLNGDEEERTLSLKRRPRENKEDNVKGTITIQIKYEDKDKAVVKRYKHWTSKEPCFSLGILPQVEKNVQRS
eukprot:TRINITY_DN6709_c0_g1_i1.p2 TRINITY_DN6709_c0_g1~~TRINITY_DN6709_c0_g1_i1.p2  ORF type:complete len:174 (+),score=30.91 TRINITY_DN6709_c0_g1_i1:51-572(+)